ncbi:hypothetical protein ACHAW6_010117 [Cyclotella cf. meneghiniana]
MDVKHSKAVSLSTRIVAPMLEKYSVLEKSLVTPRDIACARARCLGVMSISDWLDVPFVQVSGGLPAILAAVLSEAFQAWERFYQLIPGIRTGVPQLANEESTICKERGAKLESVLQTTRLEFCQSIEVNALQNVLNLLARVSRLDSTLDEEISRAGCQAILSRLIKQIKTCILFVESSGSSEKDFDALMDLQDTACEILYFPGIKGAMAFTDEELLSRLPLIYNMRPASPVKENDDVTTILIHQVTKRQTAQADVGFLIWPSAIVLGRWLLSNRHVLRGKTILEIGAGCGLVGILAATIVKDCNTPEKVVITDVNNTVLENIFRNINLNDLSSVASVAKLDFYRQTGDNYAGKWIAGEFNEENERQRTPVDIVLAADIICQPDDAAAAAKTIYDALNPGGMAYVICANEKHRFGVGMFASECEKVNLTATQANVREMYHGNLLTESMDSAAGFVDDMTLTFFEVAKYKIQ